MSKSVGGPNSCIFLTNSPELIVKKFKRAVTDSGSEVLSSPDKPALANLLSIYSLFSGESIPKSKLGTMAKGMARSRAIWGKSSQMR